MQPRSELSLFSVAGTALRCGLSYGEQLQPLLRGFLSFAVPKTPADRRFARQCWPHIEKCSPTSASFMHGVARASGLDLTDVVMLSLHEEFSHRRARRSSAHCTAVAATGPATRKGKTLVAQNWDWSPRMYPWASLLKLAIQGQPRIFAYQYPGLWTSAGINDRGLALLWTSGGLFPMVEPRAGLPTYVVIAELLARKTVAKALEFLRGVRQAGSFIFLLGDALGHIAVVEAIPGLFRVAIGADIHCRANLFRIPDVVKASRQDAKKSKSIRCEARHDFALRSLHRQHGHIDSRAIRETLQHPRVRLDMPGLATLNSLAADCQDRTLSVCRGLGNDRRSWKDFSL